MLRGLFGNLIFAIIARMLCGNHLNIARCHAVQNVMVNKPSAKQNFLASEHHQMDYLYLCNPEKQKQ